MALIGIDSWQPFPVESGYSQDATFLRVWYNRSFIDSDGISVQGGNGSTGFYIPVTVTVTGSQLSIASFFLRTTLDAEDPAPQSIQCFARLYSNNAPKQWIFSWNSTPTGWVIPNPAPLTTMTYEQLALYNQTFVIVNPPTTFWTATQVQQYFDTLSPAPNASDITKGITKLSVVPVSAVNPIAVGDNDPRIKFMPDILAVGTFTLVAGTTVTVTPVSTVAIDSPILVIPAANGITGNLRWTNRVAATSFDVFSDEGGDAGLFMYFIFAQP